MSSVELQNAMFHDVWFLWKGTLAFVRTRANFSPVWTEPFILCLCPVMEAVILRDKNSCFFHQSFLCRTGTVPKWDLCGSIMFIISYLTLFLSTLCIL